MNTVQWQPSCSIFCISNCPSAITLWLLPPRLMQQERKVFQSTVWVVQVLNSELTNRSFAPNCLCADETPPWSFRGPSGKARGGWGWHWIYCIFALAKRCTGALVSVLKQNAETYQLRHTEGKRLWFWFCSFFFFHLEGEQDKSDQC